MDWQPIETAPDKTEVLLCWTYPASPKAMPIIRMGTRLFRPWNDEPPVFKVEIVYGDAGAWVYTPKDDAPSHWTPLPAPPAAETPAQRIERRLGI